MPCGAAAASMLPDANGVGWVCFPKSVLAKEGGIGRCHPVGVPLQHTGRSDRSPEKGGVPVTFSAQLYAYGVQVRHPTSSSTPVQSSAVNSTLLHLR